MQRGPGDAAIIGGHPGACVAVPLNPDQEPPAAGRAGQTLITEQLFQHKHARVSFSGGGGLEREERSQL